MAMAMRDAAAAAADYVDCALRRTRTAQYNTAQCTTKCRYITFCSAISFEWEPPPPPLSIM